MMNDMDEHLFPLLGNLPNLSSQHLSGEQGANREIHHRCQIHAKNDYEAIQCWLNEYRHKASTFRTYQKESERFLLWAVFQRRKALSSLDRDDIEEYLKFLNDPQPKEVWCAKKNGRGCRRGDPEWRPFTGPLSHSARTTAISSIDSLFNYLLEARYLSFNPFSLLRKHERKISIKHGEIILHLVPGLRLISHISPSAL